MQNFYYVYILIDTATETHHYAGSTQDLSAVAFDSKEKAIAFEDYLKSGSGREFAKRHF